MKTSISDRFSGNESRDLKGRARKMLDKASGASMLGLVFDESMKGGSIRIKVTNNTTSTKVVALFTGGLTTVDEIKAIAGLDVDMIAAHGNTTFNEGTAESPSNKTVVVDCPKLAYYQREINVAPQRIDYLQLQASAMSQLMEKIYVGCFNLIRNFGIDTIEPGTYADPTYNIDTLLKINDFKNFQIDHNHVLAVSVAAGQYLDLTIGLGYRFSPAQFFEDAVAEVL